jgi:hypothetical protein
MNKALKRLRQKDGKFRVSLGNIARSCLKTKQKEMNKA